MRFEKWASLNWAIGAQQFWGRSLRRLQVSFDPNDKNLEIEGKYAFVSYRTLNAVWVHRALFKHHSPSFLFQLMTLIFTRLLDLPTFNFHPNSTRLQKQSLSKPRATIQRCRKWPSMQEAQNKQTTISLHPEVHYPLYCSRYFFTFYCSPVQVIFLLFIFCCSQSPYHLFVSPYLLISHCTPTLKILPPIVAHSKNSSLPL